MDVVARETIAELVDAAPARALSLFLPTHRAGLDSRPYAEEDVIRWKNQLREAEQALLDSGATPREAEQLLAPARARTDDVKFWQYQSDGLAALPRQDSSGPFRHQRSHGCWMTLSLAIPTTHRRRNCTRANQGTREATFEARRTILTQGSVFVLDPEEVPGGGPVAALLRYP